MADNGGFEVLAYDIDLAIGLPDHQLKLEVVLNARLEQNLSAFNLEFTGYSIMDSRADNTSEGFERYGSELTVRPAQPLPVNDVLRVVFEHQGEAEPISAWHWGDGEFFEVLRRIFADHRESNASPEDFIQVAEQVSQEDLAGFFEV